MMFFESCDEEAISLLVQGLREQEEKRRQALGRLLEGGWRKNPNRFCVRVSRFTPIELKVAGVDGGMAQFSLKSFDLFLLKSLAVVFRYSGRGLHDTQYIPSEFPPLNVLGVHEPLDRLRLEVLAGIERQAVEVRTAAQVVENVDVDLLLLDGSVVPQYIESYCSEPLLQEEREKLVESYTRLYQECTRRGIFLAGVVKDSRGKRFVEMLASTAKLEGEDRETLERARDCSLLDLIMRKGERTRCLPYADGEEGDPLQELGGWGKRVYLFYLKPSNFDLPLRVEFIEPGGDEELTASCIASWIFFLSSFSEEFAVPPVLLEADLRARMSEEEALGIRDQVVSRLEDPSKGLPRRERKPF